MCLQLPPMTTLVHHDGDDGNDGSQAMAKLASLLENIGMIDVDISRLTARIPVVKFICPVLINGDDDGDNNKVHVECDISLQNPLACLNTSLLQTYSQLLPEVGILASIIKRWARNRDINDPSRHTLSSYGYVLMLLHFLHTHAGTSDGRIVSLLHDATGYRSRDVPLDGVPLLPNLQWVDPSWIKSPYGEYKERRVTTTDNTKSSSSSISHPSEPLFTVNAYFLRVPDVSSMNLLRQRLSSSPTRPRPSIGLILAAFFRYHAHEFDHRRFVVAPGASISSHVEREAKAELDGWRLPGTAAICIEDPFETFYDVAHVVTPGEFKRIKGEFVRAYTVLAHSCAEGMAIGVKGDKRKAEILGRKILDRICEPVIRE